MDECLKRGWTASTRRDILAYFLFALSVFFRVVVDRDDHPDDDVQRSAGIRAHRAHPSGRDVGRTHDVRVARCAAGRWRDVLLVAVLIVEDLYGFFLELCAVAAATKCLAGKRQAW